MRRSAWLIPLALFFAPLIASAHEVYVLSSAQITEALGIPPFNMVRVALANLHEFIFWGFIAALTIFCVFFISLSHILEDRVDPLFDRLRKHAAPIARVTVGLSFLAAAYYQASYGPELPLANTFGAYSGIVTVILLVIGTLIIFGLYARIAALVALCLFTIAVWYHGIYMLTYTNYLGEIIVLLILGAHHGTKEKKGESKLAKAFAPYSFLILRICFGISLFYASLYAKILHNNLALMVAELPLAGHPYGIAHYLGFEPHFLVLGAAIVELLIATFFILGIEIRFTSLFLLFWLSLSLWWFGEVVWPHIILIGIPVAFICYGYDSYSLEGWLMKRGAKEPVL
jgi:uncharacterized membrane protein YphA (DoxX/SURF4 family)